GMGISALRPTLARLAEPDAAPERYYRASPDNQLVADPGRRRRVDFASDGLRLAGHLYRPPRAGAADRTPAIVMCGPSSSVKEQTLPHYAERFADAGYTVLTFDPRTYGDSEGEPRCYYDPDGIIADYSNAVSYLLTRDDVDGDRIALVGVCMGGGYAISTAARDKRVRCVVSIAGGFDIGGTFLALLGADGFAKFIRQINDLVTDEYGSGKTRYIPAIAPDLSAGLAFMPNPEAYSYYDRTSRTTAPNWENRVAVKSLPSYFAYDAVAHARLVAPTPMLILHGTVDLFLWPEIAQRVYDAASGDKEIAWIETHNHIELYDQDPFVGQAAAYVVKWLKGRG
ncbi:MAG TPA: alpha/beta hydrolase, partial [Candidatus Limnocylindrales bacterium]